MRLDKDRIKESLNEHDVELILRDLGSSSPKQDTQGSQLFQTVCHGGHKHKLYYYPNKRTFHCYTECAETFDIYSLVERVKKISFPQAVRYVANLTGKQFTSTFRKAESHIINDWEWIEKYQKREKINPQLPIFDETVLDVFLPYGHELWENEGISLDVQEMFGICYYVKQDQIIIPTRDIHGNLIGIRSRNLREEELANGKKYIPTMVEGRMYNFPSMFNLWGLHKTCEAVKRLKKIILYEGEKSVLKTQQYYQEDNFAVAVCGSSISNYHRDLILSLGVEEVFIGFDKGYEDHDSDKAQKYAETLLRFAKKFTPYVKTYILFDEWNLLDLKDSPVDKGKEVLEILMRRKFEIGTSDGG